ncbi:hypothetical protein EUX98_g2044 [Antrodiella citrinella]|uniref:Uncharacterized protein n=1 Tax=Antrodiella citrinella TaxID=2447956 RepID=A0A4S4N005_9APHY|nr:hypothetical protein EUX98_g2044 [Antrodiella citrinella]
MQRNMETVIRFTSGASNINTLTEVVSESPSLDAGGNPAIDSEVNKELEADDEEADGGPVLEIQETLFVDTEGGTSTQIPPLVAGKRSNRDTDSKTYEGLENMPKRVKHSLDALEAAITESGNPDERGQAAATQSRSLEELEEGRKEMRAAVGQWNVTASTPELSTSRDEIVPDSQDEELADSGWPFQKTYHGHLPVIATQGDMDVAISAMITTSQYMPVTGATESTADPVVVRKGDELEKKGSESDESVTEPEPDSDEEQPEPGMIITSHPPLAASAAPVIDATAIDANDSVTESESDHDENPFHDVPVITTQTTETQIMAFMDKVIADDPELQTQLVGSTFRGSTQCNIEDVGFPTAAEETEQSQDSQFPPIRIARTPEHIRRRVFLAGGRNR